MKIKILMLQIKSALNVVIFVDIIQIQTKSFINKQATYKDIKRYIYWITLGSPLSLMTQSSRPVYFKCKLVPMMNIRHNLMQVCVMVQSLKVSQSYLHTVLSAGHICSPILWKITSKQLYYLSREGKRVGVVQVRF